jgi:hypothetical protein
MEEALFSRIHKDATADPKRRACIERCLDEAHDIASFVHAQFGTELPREFVYENGNQLYRKCESALNDPQEMERRLWRISDALKQWYAAGLS